MATTHKQQQQQAAASRWQSEYCRQFQWQNPALSADKEGRIANRNSRENNNNKTMIPRTAKELEAAAHALTEEIHNLEYRSRPLQYENMPTPSYGPVQNRLASDNDAPFRPQHSNKSKETIKNRPSSSTGPNKKVMGGGFGGQVYSTLKKYAVDRSDVQDFPPPPPPSTATNNNNNNSSSNSRGRTTPPSYTNPNVYYNRSPVNSINNRYHQLQQKAQAQRKNHVERDHDETDQDENFEKSSHDVIESAESPYDDDDDAPARNPYNLLYDNPSIRIDPNDTPHTTTKALKNQLACFEGTHHGPILQQRDGVSGATYSIRENNYPPKQRRVAVASTLVKETTRTREIVLDDQDYHEFVEVDHDDCYQPATTTTKPHHRRHQGVSNQQRHQLPQEPQRHHQNEPQPQHLHQKHQQPISSLSNNKNNTTISNNNTNYKTAAPSTSTSSSSSSPSPFTNSQTAASFRAAVPFKAVPGSYTNPFILRPGAAGPTRGGGGGGGGRHNNTTTTTPSFPDEKRGGGSGTAAGYDFSAAERAVVGQQRFQQQQQQLQHSQKQKRVTVAPGSSSGEYAKEDYEDAAPAARWVQDHRHVGLGEQEMEGEISYEEEARGYQKQQQQQRRYSANTPIQRSNGANQRDSDGSGTAADKTSTMKHSNIPGSLRLAISGKGATVGEEVKQQHHHHHNDRRTSNASVRPYSPADSFTSSQIQDEMDKRYGHHQSTTNAEEEEPDDYSQPYVPCPALTNNITNVNNSGSKLSSKKKGIMSTASSTTTTVAATTVKKESLAKESYCSEYKMAFQDWSMKKQKEMEQLFAANRKQNPALALLSK
ncbi:hypothetical protein BDR26DRAFT_872656 [Obelidium mucronatum]|nr:hypothetical protein BDR26DRAFT_872656 [Obelidium mucronatum]